MLRRFREFVASIGPVRRWRHKRKKRRVLSEPATLLLAKTPSPIPFEVETTFETSIGTTVPVLGQARYQSTPALSYINQINLLRDLGHRGLLSNRQRSDLQAAIGHRTLTIPVDALNALTSEGMARAARALVPSEHQSPEMSVVMPTDLEISGRVDHEWRVLRERLDRIAVFTDLELRASDVLEIGYTTGGYSLFAFEKLGYHATGIDNSYDGVVGAPRLAEAIAGQLRSNVVFDAGDICARTTYPDASFNLIYSVSVLEHLRDLDAALSEMRRLLRPGGILVHGYNPFFSPNGGHPWGQLDAPWAHLRVPLDDVPRYLRYLRRHEAALALPFIEKSMNYEQTIQSTQYAINQAGFRISLWDEVTAPPLILRDLTPEILRDILLVHPDLSLADITSSDVLVVAELA